MQINNARLYLLKIDYVTKLQCFNITIIVDVVMTKLSLRLLAERLEYEGEDRLVPDVMIMNTVLVEVVQRQLRHRQQVGKHDRRSSAVDKSLTHLGVENAVGFDEPFVSRQPPAVLLRVVLVAPNRQLLALVLGVPARPDEPRRRRHQLVDESCQLVDVGRILAQSLVVV